MNGEAELPVIQRTYDLILWYVPRLNKFPRDFKFLMADRIQGNLLGFLEGLIRARYTKDRLSLLVEMNGQLNVLRYQTRLCKDFALLDVRRYEYATGLLDAIGKELGGWIRRQRRRADETPRGPV